MERTVTLLEVPNNVRACLSIGRAESAGTIKEKNLSSLWCSRNEYNGVHTFCYGPIQSGKSENRRN